MGEWKRRDSSKSIQRIIGHKTEYKEVIQRNNNRHKPSLGNHQHPSLPNHAYSSNVAIRG